MPDNFRDKTFPSAQEPSIPAPETPGMPGRQTPLLLSVRQIADIFHRTPRTIRQWIADNKLQVIRVGRAVFISQEEINRMLGI